MTLRAAVNPMKGKARLASLAIACKHVHTSSGPQLDDTLH